MEIRNEVEKRNSPEFRDCRKVLENVPFKGPEFRNAAVFDWNRISIADSGLNSTKKIIPEDSFNYQESSGIIDMIILKS